MQDQDQDRDQDRVDTLKPGNTVIFWDAKLGMPKGIMKQALDKRGFDVKEDNNFSLVEYEYVQAYVYERTISLLIKCFPNLLFSK
ncbi:hypothetical protein ZWY2020_005042 [Hordeum vulgare]|nr:hypothetical protein ZWY2020_005042 [Hordeum vulgare]